MSFTRLFRWKCDFCAAVQEKETYKLPDGWEFILPAHAVGNGGQNACDKCAGAMPESWKWRERR